MLHSGFCNFYIHRAWSVYWAADPVQKLTGVKPLDTPRDALSAIERILMENLVVQSKVREMFKKYDCNTGSDALDKLNDEVARLVKVAAERTKQNGRKTVKGADI